MSPLDAIRAAIAAEPARIVPVLLLAISVGGLLLILGAGLWDEYRARKTGWPKRPLHRIPLDFEE